MVFEALALHALLAPAFLDLKCGSTKRFPGVADRTPVMVLDGHVITGDPDVMLATIQPEDLDQVEVSCWNPDTDEMPARDGVPVILITTLQAVEDAQADIRFLLNSIRGFEAAESRLPASLEELGLTGFVADRFEYVLSGVTAEIRTAGPRAHHCTISGDLVDDARLWCEPSLSLAKANLRAVYERGDT